MNALPMRGGACVPTPAYGVIIIIVVLVPVIILVRQGFDPMTATGAIITAALAAVDATRRLLRDPDPNDRQSTDVA